MVTTDTATIDTQTNIGGTAGTGRLQLEATPECKRLRKDGGSRSVGGTETAQIVGSSI
jgi:hypothetical protein